VGLSAAGLHHWWHREVPAHQPAPQPRQLHDDGGASARIDVPARPVFGDLAGEKPTRRSWGVRSAKRERRRRLRRLVGVNAVVRAVVVGSISVVLATSCTGGSGDHRSTAGAPIRAVVPARAPLGGGGRGCAVVPEIVTTATATATVEQGLVDVDRSPSAVVMVWVPGLNQPPCRAELMHRGIGIARGLAGAVDTAPAVPPGSSACGAADNSGLDLYFLYPGESGEYAHVSLSGCEGVGAPGRESRQMSDALSAVLKPLAPAPWRNRFY
jgi:hypothetical protein